MYYQRTYLDKCATIVRGSDVNTGLNPVSDLLWGRNVSRLLVHFGHERIKSLVDDRTYPDISRLHHRLRMTNAGSLDMSELHKVYGSQVDASRKRRASSFDLIFFLLPEMWDAGKGFDYTKTYLNTDYYDRRSYDYKLYMLEDGVSWYKARNGYPWKYVEDFRHTQDGLMHFYMKSDMPYVSSTGGTLVFTYYCECNGNFNNTGLEFRQVNRPVDNPCTVGDTVFFAKNGQICQTEEQREKYCTYVQVPVTFSRATSDKARKLTFRIEFRIGERTYRSNPYTVTQLGLEDSYHPVTEDGVYSAETLEKELQKYRSGEESVVIATQHFDLGCEDIDVDITDTFNKFITGELPNCGIGIAYAPEIEVSESLYENYTGILTNKTNTFFEPYVETTCDDSVRDDRQRFILGRKNRLYLYSQIGGNLENLDQMPTCTVEGQEYEVRQQSRGIYYIDIQLPQDAFSAPTMLYDRWDGIVYQGEDFGPVELDFTTIPARPFFGIGTSMPERNSFTPTCYGIEDNERIKRGDVRKLCLLMNKKYVKDAATLVDGVQARLYVMDGTAQVDVIPYVEMDRSFTDTYLMIDTSILIPGKYHVDVRVRYGMESIEHHDILTFTIVDDGNNIYA